MTNSNYGLTAPSIFIGAGTMGNPYFGFTGPTALGNPPLSNMPSFNANGFYPPGYNNSGYSFNSITGISHYAFTCNTTGTVKFSFYCLNYTGDGAKPVSVWRVRGYTGFTGTNLLVGGSVNPPNNTQIINPTVPVGSPSGFTGFSAFVYTIPENILVGLSGSVSVVPSDVIQFYTPTSYDVGAAMYFTNIKIWLE